MKIARASLMILVSALSILLSAGTGVEADTFPPLPEALEALVTDPEVTVTRVEVEGWEEGFDFYYSFLPNGVTPTVGLIIYPGGLVDSRSYAPLARAIAAQGYLAVTVSMVNDLAVGESVQRASRIMDDFPAIGTWAIGGHSLGGYGSCVYTQEHPEKVDAVVLWAAYPTNTARIDDKEVAAVSIYGTNDGVVTLQEILASTAYLPPDTLWVPIQGGNHTQFGWYDTAPDPLQPGDNPADITREDQQDQIVLATVAFLESLGGSGCPVTYLLGEGHAGVDSARAIRDAVFADTAAGKYVTDLYYKSGRRVVAFLRTHPTLKQTARTALEWFLTGSILGVFSMQ